METLTYYTLDVWDPLNWVYREQPTHYATPALAMRDARDPTGAYRINQVAYGDRTDGAPFFVNANGDVIYEDNRAAV